MINTLTERERSLSWNYCADCGNAKFVADSETGEIVCTRCGLVIQDEMFDQTPEWRAYTPEEGVERMRIGPPTSLTMYDKGLSTIFRPRENASRSPEQHIQPNMVRLRKWDVQAKMRSSDWNLTLAMQELSRFADALHLPDEVKANAAFLYRKALHKQLVRGRSIIACIAAAVYAACRLTQTPRSLEQIIMVSMRPRKEVTRNYRLIHHDLNLTMPVDDSIAYVSHIASRVPLSQRTQNLAIDLLRKAKMTKIDSGKNPRGMAAAALYITAHMNGETVTQKKLAQTAGVTAVTIRNRCQTLNNIPANDPETRSIGIGSINNHGS
jgi:transcription initiation factor TFIIB